MANLVRKSLKRSQAFGDVYSVLKAITKTIIVKTKAGDPEVRLRARPSHSCREPGGVPMNRFSRTFIVVSLLANLFSLWAQSPQSQEQNPAIPRVPPPSANLSVQELEEEGDALRAQKDYLDAMDYYQAAMKKSPSAVLHNKLGVCLIQLSRFSDARKQFEVAVKMDGKYAEAHNNLGVTYYQVKR